MRRLRSVCHSVKNIHCCFWLYFEFSLLFGQRFNLIFLVAFIFVIDLLDVLDELVLIFVKRAVFLLMKFIFWAYLSLLNCKLINFAIICVFFRLLLGNFLEWGVKLCWVDEMTVYGMFCAVWAWLFDGLFFLKLEHFKSDFFLFLWKSMGLWKLFFFLDEVHFSQSSHEILDSGLLTISELQNGRPNASNQVPSSGFDHQWIQGLLNFRAELFVSHFCIHRKKGLCETGEHRYKLPSEIEIIVFDQFQYHEPVFSDRCVGKVRQDANTVSAQVFCEHLDVIVDVAVSCDFHVRKNYVVYSQDAFMDFLG